ncbi:MAG: 6-carboxytetrahydropterin synthase QueD [Lachnospiraceae bacterium]|nr:6-carboxytetrahydropterin synthase QueD [Lachnospiraceae bacterium]
MYYLRTEANFDAAHFLKDYDGKCANIHGHRWRVVAEVAGEELVKEGSSRGMVIEFSELKTELRAICDSLDHALIYESNSLKDKTIEALREEGFELRELPCRPTAENLAKYFFDKIREKVYDIHRIEVYESPNDCAVYEKP